MTYREIFEAELRYYNVRWCRGIADDCHLYNNHRRGFVNIGYERVVHLDSAIATRSSLMRGLHEIGHTIQPKGLRRWQQEAFAESFATRRLRELGVAVPRKAAKQGKQYVARTKRFADRVSAGLKARAKGEQ